MQSPGSTGISNPTRTSTHVEQKVTVDLVDIEKGVYLDQLGNPTDRRVPDELLKKCREVANNES